MTGKLLNMWYSRWELEFIGVLMIIEVPGVHHMYPVVWVRCITNTILVENSSSLNRHKPWKRFEASSVASWPNYC